MRTERLLMAGLIGFAGGHMGILAAAGLMVLAAGLVGALVSVRVMHAHDTTSSVVVARRAQQLDTALQALLADNVE